MARSRVTPITGGLISTNDSASFDVANVNVKKGDTIDFSVGNGFGSGDHADSTGLAATITTSGTYQYHYDWDDYPTSVILPNGTTATYTMNGDKHRVLKTANGQTTTYIFDGDTIVEEIGPSGAIYHVPGVGFVAVPGGSSPTTQSYYQENALGRTMSVSNTYIMLSLTPCSISIRVQMSDGRRRQISPSHWYMNSSMPNVKAACGWNFTLTKRKIKVTRPRFTISRLCEQVIEASKAS